MRTTREYKPKQSRVIQKKNKTNQCFKIPANIASQNYNRDIDNPGNAPANIQVAQYANIAGTFHHIYPKSKLIEPLRTIEKCFQYFSNSKHNGANSEEVGLLKILRNQLIIGNANANSYYWNRGTGFGGYAPQYRIDDPGDNVEKKCPKGMNVSIFEIAKDKRPSNLTTLSSNIKNGNLKTSDIQNCIKSEETLSKSVFYNTDTDTDWAVKTGFENDRGQAKKIYSIK